MDRYLQDYKELLGKLKEKLELLGGEAPSRQLWEDFPLFLKNIDTFSVEELENKIVELQDYLEELDDDLGKVLQEAQDDYDQETNDHNSWYLLSI